MIDVRELQRKGVVRIPKDEVVVPTNKDGFVEMGTTKQAVPSGTSVSSGVSSDSSSETTSGNLFGFLGSDTPSSNTSDQFSSSVDGYNKREVDAKVTELDNKVYKLEQRIELLEKKLDVNQPQQSTGPMGW